MAITVKITDEPDMKNQQPRKVYLAKLNRFDESLQSETIIESSSHYGSTLYFFNMEPGLYAAVAMSYDAQHENGTQACTLFFNQDTVTKSMVYAEPETFTYLGEFTAENCFTMKKADPVQEYYYSQIAPAHTKKNLVHKAVLSDKFYISVLKASNTSLEHEKGFLLENMARFQKTGWLKMLEKRIRDIDEGKSLRDFKKRTAPRELWSI